MLYISSGHNPLRSTDGKIDFGASGCGFKEADLTIIQRNLVCKELDLQGIKYVTDKDNETLAQYLKRIITTPNDVVLEFHFNAFNSKASGVETIVSDNATNKSLQFAKELNDVTAFILGLPNRSVKRESQSARGKLGIMRENATTALIELCFIDNCNDVKKWELNKEILAIEYVKIIKKYIL